MCVGNRIYRSDIILSHKMKRTIINITNEIVDRNEEIMFHVV